MAKIPRVTAKIFGSSLTANPNGLEVFGSFAQGAPVYSTDAAAIQSPAWLFGWDDALQGRLPVLEDLNALGFVHSQQIAYILQQGVAEYDAGTTYFIGSLVQSNNQVFISAVDNNIGNTPGSTSQWYALLSTPYFWGGVTTGSPNALGLVISGFPVYPTATIPLGTLILFVASNTNTDACTLNINAYGTKGLYGPDGNNLTPGQIVASTMYLAMFDGFNFRIISGLSQPTTLDLRTWLFAPDCSSKLSGSAFTSEIIPATSTTIALSTNSTYGAGILITGAHGTGTTGLQNSNQATLWKMMSGFSFTTTFRFADPTLAGWQGVSIGFIESPFTMSGAANPPQNVLVGANGACLNASKFTGGSGNWTFVWNNGSGTPQIHDTGIAIDNLPHVFSMVVLPSGNITFGIDSTFFTTPATTFVPTTFLDFQTAGVAITNDIQWVIFNGRIQQGQP